MPISFASDILPSIEKLENNLPSLLKSFDLREILLFLIFARAAIGVKQSPLIFLIKDLSVIRDNNVFSQLIKSIIFVNDRYVLFADQLCFRPPSLRTYY